MMIILSTTSTFCLIYRPLCRQMLFPTFPLRYQHTFHKRCLLANSRRTSTTRPIRQVATHSPPGFGSNTPPSTGPRAYKPKQSIDRDPNSSTKVRSSSRDEASENVTKITLFQRLRIGPRKLFILSILACVGSGAYAFHTDPHRSAILQPKYFTPFILESRDKVSSTSSILHLQSLPKGQNTDNVAEAWRTGIWSLQVMQPELQIARSYTPLPPSEDAEPEQLRLFVRKEPHGEVSTFLHRISRGTLVHLRGPQLEYEIPEDVEEVLFVAGGTGIAPALQVAHILYNYRHSSSNIAPKLRILWANRRREDSYLKVDPEHREQRRLGLLSKALDTANPSTQSKFTFQAGAANLNGLPLLSQSALVRELESLKTNHPNRIQIDYFVDEDNTRITGRLLRNYLGDPEQLKDQPEGKRLLLISGPEGFVDFYAGPKLMKGGRETQGSLGGVLKEIGPQGWDIWKL